ncbi:MAG: hypothetical protein AB1726_18275 [Planctomycetota bacterium]
MTYGSASFNIIAHLVMLGWIPLCIALFLVMKPARAVATGLVTGLLLLPNISYELHRLPEFDKTIAVGFGVAIGAILFDRQRLLAFRPRWVDLPVAVLCLSAFCSSVANDRGLWDGLSGAFDQLARWGVPWILGRIYFAEFRPQQQLVLVIIVGALIYTPFCVFEMKMSPLLHRLVYGVMLKSVKHANKGFVWRPNVFLIHGLMCAMYLAMAAFLAFTLWITRARRDLFGFPILAVLAVLGVMTVGVSSKNALLMFLGGVTCILLAKQLRWKLPLLLLVLAAPVYVGLRQGLGWEGTELVEVVEPVFGAGRAASLQARFDSENLLHDRVNERAWFGWADAGEFTGNQSITGESTHESFDIVIDSMWLIYAGTYGLVGLAAAFAIMLLPPLLAWKLIPARHWTHPALAVTVALSILSALLALDCLLNSFDNPVFLAGGGGVAGLLGTREGRARWQ